MKLELRVLLGLMLAAGAAIGQADDDKAVAKLASQVCATCHGPRGASPTSAFPRLAGQQSAYIEAQLKGFRDRTRGDPGAQAYMWGMASQLGDDTIRGLAAYYASQVPVAGTKGDAKLTELGKAIWEKGAPDNGVPACTTCHGEKGEGKDANPRLAGQHAPYLVKQLAYFKSEQRGNAPIMHMVGQQMTFDQMEAVATYAASK